MNNGWTITYEVKRHDFWLDYYHTCFRHPWVRWLIYAALTVTFYHFGRDFYRTHSLITAVHHLIYPHPLLLAAILLRMLCTMPTTTRIPIFTATIDAWGLKCVQSKKQHNFSWKKIMYIRQTTDDVLFFTWNGGTFMVPRRTFIDLDEAHRFYQTAQLYRHLAKSGQTLPVLNEGEVWPPAPRPGA